MRPATEPNTVQRPELLRQLQRFLGLRQSHIAPTLNEGVQPVIILGDISERQTSIEVGGWAGAEGFTLTGATTDTPPTWGTAILDNPLGSGVKCRLNYISLQGVGQGTTPQVLQIGYTANVIVPNGTPPKLMLLCPDNAGAVFTDGNVGRYAPSGVVPPGLGWPVFQGRPKCGMYVGKTDTPNDYGQIMHPSVTDQLGDRFRDYRPANVWLYPAQQFYIRFASNATGVGTVHVTLEWFEEPLGSGQGTP